MKPNKYYISIDKIGTVKEEAFFTLLKLHNVALTEDEIKRLKRDYGRSGKINYTEALHSINIDLDVAILNEQKWTVPRQQQATEAQNAHHHQPSKTPSQLSRLSLRDFNKERGEGQQQHQPTTLLDLGDYGSLSGTAVVNAAGKQ